MADFKKHADGGISPHPQPGLQDYFDLLPDPILLLIFNKLLDARSLCRCLLVSKRFASLVPEINSISVDMGPCSRSKKPSQDSLSSRRNNFFKGFVSKFVAKPFQFLHQILGVKKLSSSSSKDSGLDVLQWIGSALKNFSHVQSLKLQLPCYGGEIGANKTIPLLKWEASFGKELERCVILGATSIAQRREKVVGTEGDHGGSEQAGEDEPIFTDEELKLRIIWIISCLIASSARHNLVKKVVDACPKLSSAVISDAGKQGKLSMDAGQIKELRESMKGTTNNPSESVSESESESPALASAAAASSSSSQMGYEGNLVMKLWYVKELELQRAGQVMKGATMVVIRPDHGKEERERGLRNNDGGIERAFEGDEVFGEAARELLRRKEKRVYRLEMNTF